jgi:hypothetical protein
MYLRNEPRFTTATNVMLQRLRGEKPHLPARIVNVSGVGFRISVQEALGVGEPLRIIIGKDHNVLVMVRYCMPVENGHSVGVERIDAWLPDDKGVPSERRDAAPAPVQPQVRGQLGLLRTIALHDQYVKRTSMKDRKRQFLGARTSDS